MADLFVVVLTGTALLLVIGIFLTFMLFEYQEKQFRHQAEVQAMQATYQEEVLKVRLEMQEQTAAAISREIHDNIGQILSLARLHLGKCCTTGAAPLAEHEQLGLALLDQAIQDLRDLSKQLSADLVDEHLLSELLHYQLELIRKTGCLETSFELVGTERPLEPEQKLLLFRIVQELFQNTLKHAEASTLKVSLHYLPHALQLLVQDNGKGYQIQELAGKPIAESGIGTRSIQYRAQLIGATLQMESAPGKGTSTRLYYTFKNNKHEDRR